MQKLAEPSFSLITTLCIRVVQFRKSMQVLQLSLIDHLHHKEDLFVYDTTFLQQEYSDVMDE